MKIVLIGYMASGKSSVGKILAEKSNCNFIDLDAYIEQKEKSSITEIFSEKGEIYFRLKEIEYLEELLNSSNDFILSVGGGTPCYGTNMELINNKSQSVYLKTSLAALFERLKKEKSKRPLIANLQLDKLKEFIAKHLFERSQYYEQASHFTITDKKTVSVIVEEIRLQLV